MTIVARTFALAVLAVVCLTGVAAPPEKPEDQAAAPAPAVESAKKVDSEAAKPPATAAVKGKTETAMFAGGCFWSMEAVFERIKGVKNVTSGFSGGTVPYPSYDAVCTSTTGHAETVQVEFDPSVVSYETLLKYFWAAHDPTTLNSQGDDFGPQYRSMIFYRNEAQRQAALTSYNELKARHAFRSPIVTELVPFRVFYPAEAYHQDYYRNHVGNEYSTIYIEPKLRKLKLMGSSSSRRRTH